MVKAYLELKIWKIYKIKEMRDNDERFLSGEKALFFAGNNRQFD